SGVAQPAFGPSATLENSARTILSRQPIAARGAFLYGNTGFQVAGWVAQQVVLNHTGELLGWNDIFHRYLGDPLGMASTQWPTGGEIGGTVALSTAADYVKYLRPLLLDDGSLLSTQARALLLEPQIRWPRGSNSAQATSVGYAIGSWASDYDNDGVIDA